MNLGLSEGYLIHSRPFKETSLILELFTKDQGRVTILARGAKRPRSSFKGVLQPFQPLVVAARGRGEMLTATKIEASKSAWPMRQMNLISGLYLNELLMRLLPRHEPFTSLFEVYEKTLEALSQGQQMALHLRRFEQHLLQDLGYGLDLARDHQGNAISVQARYSFDPNHGLVVVQAGQELAIQGKTLVDFQQNQVTEQGLKELKWVFRKALHWVLGGVPLKTRELARQLGGVT